MRDTSLIKRLCCALILFILSLPLYANSHNDRNAYRVNYTFNFEPENKIAKVEIHIEHNKVVKKLNFNIENSKCNSFKSNDDIKKAKGRLIWQPKSRHSTLSYTCKINNIRDRKKQSYDAFISKDWTIFRGDDLVPAARVSSKRGAYSVATLRVNLPPTWQSVNAGWPKLSHDAKQKTFAVDNPQRRFDRPTGWMIAGKLGTRRSTLGSREAKTQVAVSAPANSDFRRMDTLAFINIVWPEIEEAFSVSEQKILIVSANDPMWRGGLSAGNSFYVHSDRPIISENGTSTLIHELFHMLTGIRGSKNDDWIAEGLAEYYSFELLYRAGASTLERKNYTLEKLEEWSKDVDSIFGTHSKGKVTAKAALIFSKLDLEIKRVTNDAHCLDSLVQQLASESVNPKRISLNKLKSTFSEVTGSESEVLKKI